MSVLSSLTNFLVRNSHHEYYGRIMPFPKSTQLHEIEYITYSPDNMFPFVMGPDTIQQLIGKSVVEIFDFIGYTRKDIEMKIESQERLILVLFTGYTIPNTDKTEPPMLATWENVLSLVERTNPICGAKVKNVLPIIQTKGYESYEFDLDRLQPDLYTHVHSFESFANSHYDSPDMVRAFLRHTMKLKKLYSGDGYSYNEKNERGSKEYLIPRVRMQDLINRSDLFDLTDELILS